MLVETQNEESEATEVPLVPLSVASDALTLVAALVVGATCAFAAMGNENANAAAAATVANARTCENRMEIFILMNELD